VSNETVTVNPRTRKSTPVANPSGRAWLLDTNEMIACAPSRRRESQASAEHREHYAFRQKLPHHAPRGPRPMPVATAISFCRAAARASIRLPRSRKQLAE